jgi:tetratricopeptide (TPR) repeat protein
LHINNNDNPVDNMYSQLQHSAILEEVCFIYGVTPSRLVNNSNGESGAIYRHLGEHYQYLGEHYQYLGEHYQYLGEHYRHLGEHYQYLGEHYQYLGERYRNLGERYRNLGEYYRHLGEYCQHLGYVYQCTGKRHQRMGEDNEYYISLTCVVPSNLCFPCAFLLLVVSGYSTGMVVRKKGVEQRKIN